MGIEIRGLSGQTALRARVRRQIETVLRRLRLTSGTTLAAFSDENGPKGGPAMRCAVTVPLPRRSAVHVEHLGGTAREAFESAFSALERRLERYREQARDLRRYPKKYYAARRLMTGGSGRKKE